MTAAQAKLLNPIEYAQLLKVRAAADAAAATTAIKPAAQTAAAKAEAARRAAGALRAAEAEHAQAEARLNAKARARDGATTPQAAEPVAAAVSAAEAQLHEAADRVKAAREAATATADEAAQAEHVRAELAKLQALGKEAARRNSPVSILVSKKDKRVYVRQGLASVLDAPAVVRDPEIPLGTHLYIATGVQADGKTLSWTVISLPAPSVSAEHHGGRRGRAGNTTHEGAQLLSASDAADALDRIDMPAEVGDKISELVWTGASLIVSDQPLSDETGDFGTDIVVKTR
jgi:hypothetical protein